MENDKKINCAVAGGVNGSSNGKYDRVFCPECNEFISRYLVYEAAKLIIEQHKKDHLGHNPKFGYL